MDVVRFANNLRDKGSKRVFMLGVVSFVVILISLTTFLHFDNSTVAGIMVLVFAGFITIQLLKSYVETTLDTNKKVLYKLQSIQRKCTQHITNEKMKQQDMLDKKMVLFLLRTSKLQYMHYDASLILFLYDILHYYDYNNHAYYELAQGVDNLLKLRSYIDIFLRGNGTVPENCYEIYQESLEVISICMNHMHSFIMSVPKSNVIYKEHGRLMRRLFVLLRRQSDAIYKACEMKRKEKVNNATKYFEPVDRPKPYETPTGFDMYV